MKRLIGMCCMFVLLLGACTSEVELYKSETDVTRGVVSQEEEFALDIFRASAIEDLKTRENTGISPYGVYQILAVMAGSDNGNCGNALLELLTGDNFSQEDILQYIRQTDSSLLKISGGEVCDIHNALWHSPDLTLKDSFTTNMTYFSNFEDFPVSPAGEDGMQKVNEWVANMTRGIIPEFLRVPIYSDAALINTVYFNALWENAGFDEFKNEVGEFSTLSKAASNVVYMKKTISADYGEYNKNRILAIPFDGGNFIMKFILPDSKTSFIKFIKSLNVGLLRNLNASLQNYKVSLRIPKFEYEIERDLLETIKQQANIEYLECKEIFNETVFSSNQIKQKFVIGINEKGASAAAVTSAIMITMGDAQPKSVELSIDRPFVYTIEDSSSGTILFMGAVTNPGAK